VGAKGKKKERSSKCLLCSWEGKEKKRETKNIKEKEKKVAAFWREG